MADWHIFRGSDEPHDGMARLPPPPPWRDFRAREAGAATPYRVGEHEIDLVNAALYLRRPLLVTGPPGVGKSTLAEAVARELKLGTVLRWSINSRSTLAEGLYQYDALARLRDATLRQHAAANAVAQVEDIGRYIRLGPLGTALYPRARPRVLLIDEIDKSDIDLPNDLLHVFEEGRYDIPELTRIVGEAKEVMVMPDDGHDDRDRVAIQGGRVRCDAFPFVILTSNGERELPPAFLRRCLRLDIQVPDAERLYEIIAAHLGSPDAAAVRELVAEFTKRREEGSVLATDQLLNAVFLAVQPAAPRGEAWQALRDAVLRELGKL